MKTAIGVLGGGSWGTALAMVLAKQGKDVEIWMRDEEYVEKVSLARENYKYLPGVLLPENISLSSDLQSVATEKAILIMAVPTQVVRETCEKAKPWIAEDTVIVNVAKGIENDTLYRISEVIGEVLPHNKYAILSGPTHAEEVSRDYPTTIVAASEDEAVANYIQDMFMTPKFRVYTNNDVIGVELGGALKNIIAVGAGISDGLKYGDNAKAALMNRGITEIARLGEAMGANKMTFTGLSGIGDLIVTCTSMHSRNRRAGIKIGEGMRVEEAVKSIGMAVEGIKTAKTIKQLMEKYQVEMPISDTIYRVLYEDLDPNEAVIGLMMRDKKQELVHLKENQTFGW